MPARSLFPGVSAKEARTLADTIASKNAGQPMRRLDIFEELHRSPDSGPGRQLVTASSAYDLTTGGYQADMLSLTTLGQRLSVENDETALIDAVLNVDAFKQFFDKYRNSAVPSETAAKSFLASIGVPPDRTKACLEILLGNGRFVGIIDSVSGTERVLTREHAIERKFGGQELVSKREAEAAEPIPGKATAKTKLPAGLPSLNINLEIHLPADVRPEVYDAIFSSMRKHLIDVE